MPSIRELWGSFGDDGRLLGLQQNDMLGTLLPAASVGKSLLTVAVGNSIAAQPNNGPQRLGVSYWATGSDLHTANMLAGGKALRFGRVTPTVRTDAWGIYSYSGQRLDTINADLPTSFYAALASANLVPDLIVGHSLLENDLGAGATVRQMTQRLTAWMLEARGRYPGALIWLLTPRPSFSYNTPTIAANYRAMRDLILSLDDNATIFATRLDNYEDPANSGNPMAGYTDATVHPNVVGGMLNGRAMAATLRRISSRALAGFRAVSNNFAMIGSAAATGTNHTGTVPTGTSWGGSANCSVVSTADDPGWIIDIAQAAGALSDISLFSMGSANVAGLGTQFSAMVRVRIESGAEQIRCLALQPRFSDGVTSPFFNFQNGAGTDADGDYRNGDELEIWCPPVTQADAGTAGALTTVTPYLRPTRKTGGAGSTTVVGAGTLRLRVLQAGVGIVA